MSAYYNPEEAKLLATVPEIVKNGRALIASHYNSDYRVRTVAVRLLEHHAYLAEKHAAALCAKALGNDEEAKRIGTELIKEFGKREVEIQKYFDHFICFKYYDVLIYSSKTKTATITV